MENQEPNLSIQDVAACLQVIDLVTTRGAFQGQELLQVGTLRERLASFLQHAQSQVPAETEEPSEEEPQED